MPFSLRLAVIACALSLTLACSNHADAPTGTSTPSGTPTAAPTPTSTPLPTSTRKGVSDGADVIINTVVAHDAISLEKLTKLATVPCSQMGAAAATATSSATGTTTATATSTPRATSTASTSGSTTPPPCPASVTGTSATDVLPVVSCESELRTKANVRRTLDSITATAPSLVGVYKVPSTYMPQTPGDTLVVFARHPTINANLAAGLLVSGDRVVAVVLGCQMTPAQIVPTGATAIFQS